MRKRAMISLGILLVWALLGFGSKGAAQTVVFDFEDQELKEGLTSLEVVTEGLTMTLTRPGDLFGLTDVVGGTFGSRSLTPFFPGTTQNTPFVADFSTTLASVSIDTGDFVLFGSELDTVRVEAFSEPGATGILLAVEQITCCDQGERFASTTVTVTAPGIRSVRFIGGSSLAANSVFYDNITVTPEVQDSDQDGYTDEVDACPHSDLLDTVVIQECDSQSPNTLHDSGCTTTDDVTACSEDAANHGDFVSCVSQLTELLTADGYLTGDEKGAIQSCAAQASLP